MKVRCKKCKRLVSKTHNRIDLETNQPASKSRPKSPVNIAVPEACIIGLIAALGAVALKNGVGLIGTLRVHLATVSPLSLPLLGLIGGLLVGFLIQYVDKGIAGSGIPQTKAALFGFPVKLGIKSAAIKLLGCIISLGSGLALGREGPTVQVAAGLSSAFSKLRKTSPVHNTQLIAAGAGAGLAAAFNAPLAGVLFVLEELIKKMSGFAVGTTVVACFVASVTSRLVGVHSLDINLLELFPKATFEFQDIPFLILLGIVTGLCGAFFNKSIIAALTLNRDILKTPPILSASLAGLLTGSLVMTLPDSFSNYAGLRELTLQSTTDIQLVAQAFIFQFVLAVLAYGSGIPGGLFAPSLTMGACLGHLVAVSEQHLIHSGDIGTMAVVGMGAFFCAVARVPITSVIIIFEMTTDFNLVLPLMICCVVAYLVAEQFDPGSLYDQLVSWSGYKLEEKEEGALVNTVLASSIMTEKVKTIPSIANLATVKSIFETVGHQGYPVVDHSSKVMGIVAKPDLLSAVQRELPPETPVKKFMTPKPITITADEPLSSVLFLMDKFKVSRLPVIERERLVGIITRKDVVAAQTQAMGIRATYLKRSYVVYQTRSPEIGNGRLLIGIEKSMNEPVFSASTKLALGKGYELECLKVLTVPESENPSAANVKVEEARTIIHTCESSARKLGLPVHTSIRVAHNIADATIETIADRNVDILIMQYQTKKYQSKNDELLSSILSNTTCKTVLLGKQQPPELERLILPVADFLNAELAMDIGKNLISSKCPITLYRVLTSKKSFDDTELNQRIKSMRLQWKERKIEIEIVEIVANSPAAILLNLKQLKQLKPNDGVVLGLPRKYLLKSVKSGLFKRNLKNFSDHATVILATE